MDFVPRARVTIIIIILVSRLLTMYYGLGAE